MNWLAWLFPPKPRNFYAEMLPKLPPVGAVPPAYLRPTQDVRLLPVARPSLAQVRGWLRLQHRLGGYLHARAVLQEGGSGFGDLTAERLATLTAELVSLELPFEIWPSRIWFDTRYNVFTAQWEAEP